MDLQGTPRAPQEESPEQTSPPNLPQASSPNPLFYNEQGIRSGWRILIYLSFGLLIYGVELVPVSFFYRVQDPFSVASIIAGETMMFTAAFGAALIMARLEDRPSGEYGLPLRAAFGKRFWQGVLIGLCEISLIVGAMAALHAYSFGNLSFHGGKILQWGGLWVVAAILIALPEEFLFRGYMQHTLAEGVGFWPAAIGLSFLFAAVHRSNPGENWVGVTNIFFTGLLWAFTLRRTGSLWLAVGWHAAFDFGESFLYSVPDSGGVFEGHLSNATVADGPAWLTGGRVGPEANVFAFVTLILGAILVHFLFPAEQKTQDNLGESQS
jgi:uncharacterized protein